MAGRRHIGLTLLLLSSPAVAIGQARPASRPAVTWPEAAAVLGGLAIGFALDNPVRNYVQGHRSGALDGAADFGNSFGDKFIVFPALGIGYLGGLVTGSSTVRRITVRAAEAGLLASAANAVLKVAVGRGRPIDRPGDPDFFQPLTLRDNAFPSGHTALAFALATSFAAETRDRLSDVGFYSLATLTALARVNFDRHWTSDVIAGAAVGVVAGRLIDRWHGARVTPVAGGLAVSIPLAH
jgi:membrane-associated phospholipid phosphatase